MKRRNKFVERCDAPVFSGLALNRVQAGNLNTRQREVAPRKVTLQSDYGSHIARCSLPRGHKGPHVLLNPITAPPEFSPEEIEAMLRKIPEIAPGQIAALHRKMANQTMQMLSGRGLFVLTVDEGVGLFPGEGSQPACGYQPASPPAIQPCALPRNHKLPHICRSKIKRSKQSPQ